MDNIEAIKLRHSVRDYSDKPVEGETLLELATIIDECNKVSGLHLQLVRNEPKAFDSALAHYGKFSGVCNYIALVGRSMPEYAEKCGYYGEKIVIEAQKLGLNTCWVALTFKKMPNAYKIRAGEKLYGVITVGYGNSSGWPHRSKKAEKVSNLNDDSPEWFKKGVEAALLAPTAMNQQKFRLTLIGNKVEARAGFGPYSTVDLGIVKYHFELGSGKGREVWR